MEGEGRAKAQLVDEAKNGNGENKDSNKPTYISTEHYQQNMQPLFCKAQLPNE